MKNEKNKNQRTLENELLVEWFTYLVENIGEEKRADKKTIKEYITKIESYKGVDFFEVQEVVNEFIRKVE